MNIITGLINGMISSATPILLAALGGSLTYYAGIFNIAMEGMMLSGAFFRHAGFILFSLLADGYSLCHFWSHSDGAGIYTFCCSIKDG